MSGWDDPATARYYQAFERAHARYRRANAALVRHAALAPGQRVLDLAAGTGGTAAAMLGALGASGRVDCCEPAAAMRDAGRARLAADPRVRWIASLDDAAASYDRIVCGAAIWQWPDPGDLLRRLAQRLAPGGALAFNLPAAYAGVPDAPGGGTDPWLTALTAALVDSTAMPAPPDADAASLAPLPDRSTWTRWLVEAGLRPWPWQHRQRLTQAAYRDWLKIPLLTASLCSGLDADERARRIDAAYTRVDAGSWRHERWFGWTGWKPAFAVAPLRALDAHAAAGAPLRAAARDDGVVLLRGVLPRAALQAVHRLVAQAGRQLGLLDARGHWCAGSAAAMHELPRWIELQQHVATGSAWRCLAGHPALLEVMGTIFGAPALAHQGSVARVAPPEHFVPATPPHRDQDYMPGRPGVWTAWLPLAACGIDDGVLAVVPASHRDSAASQWAAATLRPGDVLLFGARTLHRACPNHRPARARLSVDLRFAPAPLQAASTPTA